MTTTVPSSDVPQFVPATEESDPQLRDQSLEEFVEQTVQALMSRIEAESESHHAGISHDSLSAITHLPEKKTDQPAELSDAASHPVTQTSLITPLNTALAVLALDGFGGLWDSKYRLGTLYLILRYYMLLPS